MAAGSVNLPPGFEIEGQSSPNLPAGFELEQPRQSGVGGFINNATGDVKGILGAIQRTGQGIMDLPSDVYQTGKQMVQGQGFSETPIGQDVNTLGKTALNALPSIVRDPRSGNNLRLEPGSIFRQYQDIAALPFRAIPGQVGEAFKKEYPNVAYEHPVNTALAVAPLLGPAANAARSIPVVDQGLNVAGDVAQSGAQTMGRRALGLSKRFLNKNEGQLPAANAAAQTALDTGVIRNPLTNPFSSSAEDMLKRAQNLEESSGAQIGQFTKSQGEQFNWKQTINDLENLKLKFPDDPDVVNRIDNVKDIVTRTAKRNGGNIPFDEANKLKTYIQKKVPWNADSAASDVAKQAAGTVRSGLDAQLEAIAKKGGNQEGFANFKANKKLFGQSDIMQKGLLNKTAGESGNLPISPYSVATGAADFMYAGHPMQAIMTALGTEWIKRYGSATTATMLNDVAKILKTGRFSSGPMAEGAIPAVEPNQNNPQQNTFQLNSPRSMFGGRKAS